MPPPSRNNWLPAAIDKLPGKYDDASALFMYAVFLPAHPVAQLSGDEFTWRPASAFK